MFFVDWAMGWLTEAVFMGCGDVRLAELRLSEENTTLVELALGSPREPAGALWRKMKEYAVSRGKNTRTLYYKSQYIQLYKNHKTINKK